MRIVFASPSLPDVTGKGHETHGYQRIRGLVNRGHKISLVCFSSDRDPSAKRKMNDLLSLGVHCFLVRSSMVSRALRTSLSVLAAKVPAQVAWYSTAMFRERISEALVISKADALHCITARIAGNIPKSLSIPVSIDFIDSLGLNFQRRSSTCAFPQRAFFRREAELIARHERRWAEVADLGLVVSSIDREAIGTKSLSVLPVGVDLRRFWYGEDRESVGQSVGFTGNMNYAPNDAAARWFISNCWTKIRQSMPSCSFFVAGRKPSAGLLKLARQHTGVRVLGEVASMRQVLREASVVVAPMTMGSGMQNKILEAMAVGTPVVSNGLGLGDIRAVPGSDVMCAEGADGIADAVAYLLTSPERRASIARNARRFVEREHDWNSINEAFEHHMLVLANKPNRHGEERCS